MALQGFQSLANSLSHLKMTLEEYAIFLINLTFDLKVFNLSNLTFNFLLKITFDF